MNNILLDTNLLIYAIDEDSKYYNSVQKILDNESNNLFTTSKNISVFLSVITRYPNKSILLTDLRFTIMKLLVLRYHIRLKVFSYNTLNFPNKMANKYKNVPFRK